MSGSSVFNSTFGASVVEEGKGALSKRPLCDAHPDEKKHSVCESSDAEARILHNNVLIAYKTLEGGNLQNEPKYRIVNTIGDSKEWVAPSSILVGCNMDITKVHAIYCGNERRVVDPMKRYTRTEEPILAATLQRHIVYIVCGNVEQVTQDDLKDVQKQIYTARLIVVHPEEAQVVYMHGDLDDKGDLSAESFISDAKRKMGTTDEKKPQRFFLRLRELDKSCKETLTLLKSHYVIVDQRGPCTPCNESTKAVPTGHKQQTPSCIDQKSAQQLLNLLQIAANRSPQQEASTTKVKTPVNATVTENDSPGYNVLLQKLTEVLVDGAKQLGN